MKTRRWILAHIFAAVLPAISVLGLAEGSEPVVVRVAGLPPLNATEPIQVVELKLQEAFLKQHPDIRLVPAEGLRLENAVQEVTTVMMVAGGIAPDVLRMNFRSIDTFVRMGMVAPLDEFISQGPAGERENIEGRIPSQVLPVINRTGPGGKRELYALPTRFLFTGLYFNRELLRRAGLPQRAPNDWPELLAYCRQLKAKDPRINPLNLPAGPLASWIFLNFLWSAGGEAVVESAPDQWRAAFDTPQAVTAFDFYYQLVEGERLVRRGGQLSSPQELERTAMMFGYVGDSISFDPEKFGFGPVPAGPTGIRGAEINSTVLGLYSRIKDPNVRQAAWTYIRFMASDEAERLRVETLIDMGLAGQVNPVRLRRFGYDQYLALLPPGTEEAFREATVTGKPEPYGRNCNLIYAEMSYPLDQILTNPEIARLWKEQRFDEARQIMAGILKTAVHRTDERMLGYISPATAAKRRWVTWCVVSVMAGVFILVGWRITKVFSAASRMSAPPIAGKGLVPWLCLLPAVGLVLLWKYVPLMRGTAIAFQDYQLILPSSFVGLDNFSGVLFDPAFWNSLLATIHYAAWTLTAGFLAPILLAYGLHVIPKHKIFFRVLYYLPAVISATAVFFLWRELFGVDSILNQILRIFGLEARRAWTEDPNLAMLSCIMPGIWAGAGPGCLIYLAALKTISIEQFEAAEIDGAGFFQKTRLIVFPSLKALILINFTGAVAASFHGATNILIMTGGGPNGVTEVTSLLIFFEAFTRMRLGHATAMAWILGSMLIGITVLQLQRLSRMEFKTAK